MENNVLIITYYWPPSGGSGVQRWLKFVKYLPGAGWKPFVFTPENPSFGIRDESLLKDIPGEASIIHFPIWEPYNAFNKISAAVDGKDGTTPAIHVGGAQNSFFKKASTWVRGNLIIPDPRVFWVRPSARFLSEFVRVNKIKTIITTGPPHSIHLIGYRLKKTNPDLKWLADFRDPWSEWGFLDSLSVGAIARRLHKRLESRVLRTADEIITITPFYVRRFEALSGRPVRLLTNGFDEADFRDLKIEQTSKFIIRHVGIVNEKCDPRPFMRAIETLAKEHDVFRLNVNVDFVGEVHPQVRSFVESSELLSELVTFSTPVPHRELIALYGKSSMLLLILTGYKDAEGYMPGKLFEYIATGLPVLGTGPEDGDASRLLRESGSGEMIDGEHQSKLLATLLLRFEEWKDGRVTPHAGASVNYSRRGITSQLAKLL